VRIGSRRPDLLGLAVFVDRFPANADTGEAVGGFEDTATRQTGLVKQTGGVAHHKIVGSVTTCRVSHIDTGRV
jgi:hypothetical protein